jgi:hypothetical protein
MNASYRSAIEYLDPSLPEALLDWQVKSCDGEKTKELSLLLQKNRDRNMRVAEGREREVESKTTSRSEADRCRSIVAYLAAQRALRLILSETIASARRERKRAISLNKRNGTPIEIPEVDAEKLTHDVIRAQDEWWREICSALNVRITPERRISDG